ncbi:MAG: hypothetical protein JW715_04160 [Sedimentisphaerales bacterium]|nr:hypothetical protein [Sedimentisphaerales bacterium]
MNQEMLEILIGKYLDGEITPSEQQILEAELNRNPQAEELLRQFQDLHERSCEVVTSELLSRGKNPEEIFELAYRRQSRNPFRKIAGYRGYFRFVAGVAAGLIIGLAMHFVLPSFATTGNLREGGDVIARDPGERENPTTRIPPEIMRASAGNVVRNVDLYTYTDDKGNQWLVEGLRENVVRPAVYDGRI